MCLARGLAHNPPRRPRRDLARRRRCPITESLSACGRTDRDARPASEATAGHARPSKGLLVAGGPGGSELIITAAPSRLLVRLPLLENVEHGPTRALGRSTAACMATLCTSPASPARARASAGGRASPSVRACTTAAFGRQWRNPGASLLRPNSYGGGGEAGGIRRRIRCAHSQAHARTRASQRCARALQTGDAAGPSALAAGRNPAQWGASRGAPPSDPHRGLALATVGVALAALHLAALEKAGDRLHCRQLELRRGRCASRRSGRSDRRREGVEDFDVPVIIREAWR